MTGMRLPKDLNTLANGISSMRAVAGPVAMLLIVAETRSALLAALVIMLIAELSDLVDGIVARRQRQVTEFGKLIDPVCDSIYHLSVFLGFFANGWMPVWMLFAIYARDLTVPYLNTFARQAGRELGVRPSGIIKNVTHGVCQLAVMTMILGLFGSSMPGDAPLIYFVLTIATVASVLSLIDQGLEAVRVTAK